MHKLNANIQKMNPAEQYILRRPEPLKSILLQLQILIESTYPELDLKYKWGMPYYYIQNSPFCFLNATKKGYVDVGFWMPYKVDELEAYLVSENRKIMKSLRYYSIDDIDVEILLKVLKTVRKNDRKGFKK